MISEAPGEVLAELGGDVDLAAEEVVVADQEGRAVADPDAPEDVAVVGDDAVDRLEGPEDVEGRLERDGRRSSKTAKRLSASCLTTRPPFASTAGRAARSIWAIIAR